MARVLSSARGAMRKIWITAIASLAVHGAPLRFCLRSPAALAVQPPHPAQPAEPVDRWAGDTAEPGGNSQVYDVSVDPPGGAKPSDPPPAPPPAPVAPAPPKDGVPIDPAPNPPPPKPRKPKPASSAIAASSAATNEPGSPGKPGGASENGGGSAGGGSFGAEGPGSVRDLGKAFMRAIPLGCQGDQGWAKLSPGDAGVLEFTITVDETGHITGFQP